VHREDLHRGAAGCAGGRAALLEKAQQKSLVDISFVTPTFVHHGDQYTFYAQTVRLGFLATSRRHSQADLPKTPAKTALSGEVLFPRASLS